MSGAVWRTRKIAKANYRAVPARRAAVILLAKPADLWWVSTAEIPRASVLAALFALGGFTYLGVLYCFGFRLRDVRR